MGDFYTIELGDAIEEKVGDWFTQTSIQDLDVPRTKARLLQHLERLKPDYPFLKCDICVDYVNHLQSRKTKLSASDKRKRKKAGWTWDFNSTIGLFCKFHQTILLPAEFFERFFQTPSKVISKTSVVDSQTINRSSRNCNGVHPHCSICGMCHTNRLTHDRGHPRY